VSEQRQEFVNAEIVDLVPVLVKDVETGLEPLLLLFCGCEGRLIYQRAKTLQRMHLENLKLDKSLTEKKTFPDNAEVLLLCGLLQFHPSFFFYEHVSKFLKALIS